MVRQVDDEITNALFTRNNDQGNPRDVCNTEVDNVAEEEKERLPCNHSTQEEHQHKENIFQTKGKISKMIYDIVVDEGVKQIA